MNTQKDTIIKDVQAILLSMAIKTLESRVEALEVSETKGHRCLICGHLTINYHDHEVT